MATNLQFIKSEIARDTSSFSVDNIFSDSFNIYQIVISSWSTVGTTANDTKIRLLDSGGSVISASEYDDAVLNMRSNASFINVKNTGEDHIEDLNLTDKAPESSGAILYVYNPYNSSSYTFLQWQSSGNLTGVLAGMKGIAVHKVAETIRGINLLDMNGSRPFDGKVSVYGVK